MIGAAQVKSAAAGSQDTAAMGQHSGIQAFKYFQASPTSLPTVINKYKRRRFQKTKNLLTGETEADPEMIKVSRRRLVSSSCRPWSGQVTHTSVTFPGRSPGMWPLQHEPISVMVAANGETTLSLCSWHRAGTGDGGLSKPGHFSEGTWFWARGTVPE